MNYLTVTAPDINNGKGCRVTLWIAGCSHHCEGCHNQHTWDFNQGRPLKEAWAEVQRWLSRSEIQGLTLSGGDPFTHSEADMGELADFVESVKMAFPSKDIWAYSGAYIEQLLDKNSHNTNRVLKQCDVIVDGPFEKDKLSLDLAFRGSSNQRILKISYVDEQLTYEKLNY